jgi:agarase
MTNDQGPASIVGHRLFVVRPFVNFVLAVLVFLVWADPLAAGHIAQLPASPIYLPLVARNADARKLPPPPDLDRYGGYRRLQGAQTGYFHTEQMGGRWWLIDPLGHAFFSLGVNNVDFQPDPPFSAYHDSAVRKYGDEAHWAEGVVARLRGWGFNSIAAWSSPLTYHQGMAYTMNLEITPAAIAGGVPAVSQNFADVFDSRFPAVVSETVEAAIPEGTANDPWLLGYFLDNELYWYQGADFNWDPDEVGPTVVDDFIAQGSHQAGKHAWVEGFLVPRYASVEALNLAWGTAFTSWLGDEPSSVIHATAIPNANDVIRADKQEFLTIVADRYFAVTTQAVRARDPHHLILGTRFNRAVPAAVVSSAGEYCDVLSFNLYHDGRRYKSSDIWGFEHFDSYYNLAEKPLLISEFSYRAQDSGLPNARGAVAGVATQEERAQGYRFYLQAMAEKRYVVGTHWYKHADEPVAGRFDGEDSNYGLVTVHDDPYGPLVEGIARTNGNIYDHLLGQPARLPEPPLPRWPKHDVVYDTPAVPPTFVWQPVGGAIGYTLQVSPDPLFPPEVTLTFPQIPDPVQTLPDPLSAGRWYWRVATAAASGTMSDFSAPRPLSVLPVFSTRLINGFETPIEAAVGSEENGWRGRWVASPPASVSMARSSLYATEGSFSGQARYNGATAGAYPFQFASLLRIPDGINLVPHDWSSHEYVAFDVYNPQTSPINGELGVANDGYSPVKLYPFRVDGATEGHLIFRLRDAAAAGVDLADVQHVWIAIFRPDAGQTLYYDNFHLIDLPDDNDVPPVISLLATDARVGGTINLDWTAYDAAGPGDVGGYRVYVSTLPFVSVAEMEPVATLEAVIKRYPVQMLRPPQGEERAIPLQDGVRYYFAVTAVDGAGNENPLVVAVPAVPTEEHGLLGWADWE